MVFDFIIDFIDLFFECLNFKFEVKNMFVNFLCLSTDDGGDDALLEPVLNLFNLCFDKTFFPCPLKVIPFQNLIMALHDL